MLKANRKADTIINAAFVLKDFLGWLPKNIKTLDQAFNNQKQVGVTVSNSISVDRNVRRWLFTEKIRLRQEALHQNISTFPEHGKKPLRLQRKEKREKEEGRNPEDDNTAMDVHGGSHWMGSQGNWEVQCLCHDYLPVAISSSLLEDFFGSDRSQTSFWSLRKLPTSKRALKPLRDSLLCFTAVSCVYWFRSVLLGPRAAAAADEPVPAKKQLWTSHKWRLNVGSRPGFKPGFETWVPKPGFRFWTWVETGLNLRTSIYT